MSHLTQMAGLAVQNFVSAAVGARRRGRADPRASSAAARATIGNFWVDLDARHAPRAAAARVRRRARARRARASSRTSTASRTRTTVAGRDADDPRRPDREPGGDQGARRERRRLLQRQLRAPVREPERRSRTSSRSGRSSLIPFALTYTFGRLVKDQRQGWVLFAVDVRALARRRRPRDALRGRAATRSSQAASDASRRQHGGQGGPLRHRACRACSPPRRPARRPAPSTRRTTASRRSAARCRSST